MKDKETNKTPRKDKSGDFKKLATARMTKAITMMRLIGNLSNRRAYDYTESEKKQIIKTLEQELKSIKIRFEKSTKKTNGSDFSFD